MATLTQPRHPKEKQQDDKVTRALEHYRVLRWFAVISMLAIISWVLIDLFGPIPKYQLNNQPSADLSSREYIQQLEALSASRIGPHTHIEALPNGVNFYEAEISAIKAAKQSVNWEAYIVSKGEMAKRIVDALTERARAGVEVNLNIDAIGSAGMQKKFFNELKQAGGHVEWYHPLRWYNWPRANKRTHRELIVIDGMVGFLGGAGISDQWWHGEKKTLPGATPCSKLPVTPCARCRARL